MSLSRVQSAIRGLCETHYRQWNKRSRRSPKVTLEEWMASGEATIPDEPLPDCIVPACCRESMTSATKVCRLHWARYMRGGRAEPIRDLGATVSFPTSVVTNSCC